MEAKLAAQHFHDLIAFIFTKKSMVYKDTGQLVTNGPLQKNADNWRVNTARQTKKNLLITNSFPNFLNLNIDEVFHGPIATTTADVDSKIFQNIISIHRMTDFWMELDSKDFLVCVFDSSKRTVWWQTNQVEVSWNLSYRISMAHQNHLLGRSASKEGWISFQLESGLTIFTVTSLASWHHLPIQFMGDELHSVTDSEDWNPQFKDFWVNIESILSINRVWTAGEDDSDWIELFHLGCWNLMAFQLRKYAEFTDTARNQLVVLTTVIQNDNLLHILHCHSFFLSNRKSYLFCYLF